MYCDPALLSRRAWHAASTSRHSAKSPRMNSASAFNAGVLQSAHVPRDGSAHVRSIRTLRGR
jgi:hypothetical protein